MSKQTITPDSWVLGYAPGVWILRSLEYRTKKDAQERAREENQSGEYRGRGIKAYPKSYFTGGRNA